MRIHNPSITGSFSLSGSTTFSAGTIEFAGANQKISGSATSTGSFGKVSIKGGDLTNGGAATAPALHVGGAARIDGNIAIAPGSSTPYISGGSTGTQWRNNANSATLLTILDGGNVGIGVTPESWQSGWTVLQIGATSAIQSVGGTQTVISENLYRDSVNSRWERIEAGGVSYVNLENGRVDFLVADADDGGSGGDSAITFTQPLTLNNTGATFIGNVSGSSTSTGSFGSVHTAGKVGIGTNAPARLLHVYDADSHSHIKLESAGDNHDPQLTLVATGAAGKGYLAWGASSLSTDLYFYNYKSGTGTAMMIDGATNNIGGGTTTPNSKLHVVGDIRAIGNIIAENYIVS